MKAAYCAYQLQLRHPFTISGFSRTSTPLLLLKLSYEGIDGYGEASMVPYLGESHATAMEFLKKVDWNRFSYPFIFEEVISYLDAIDTGNAAVKAAIDIALNDLSGKIANKPCYELYGAEPAKMPVSSYTIGIDTQEVMREKALAAKDFKVLKVKLGTANDKDIIRTIRSVSNVPLYVDANQGWTDRKMAVDLVYWLHDQGVVLIEQPMDKHNLEGNAWLTQRSPIPILADEAVQRLADIERLKGAYHGINIKLMKSTGMYEGHQMIEKARSLGMKVLIGCMSESSCATLASAALAPLCNWADLDGPFLSSNNPFDSPQFLAGKYQLKDLPGIGLEGIPQDLFTAL
ncbi:chloromuconate cycloisomerase YkfB1 [Pedobacter sp. BAL39]|uniref:dipeptide epimerase n=1 Tax=Pedobacter sp. BAL39 TaxID=391596 RepID=UPI00015598F8|nr:dipeptide epimerase [Pedobacter sp. BAL39]EDM37608.1 chloromuconate cycloisomerase YkfB1 [Pedobacter sp. BAL39]